MRRSVFSSSEGSDKEQQYMLTLAFSRFPADGANVLKLSWYYNVDHLTISTKQLQLILVLQVLLN